MGGIFPGTPTIGGVVSAPGIQLEANPTTGFYRLNSGIGIAVQAANFFALYSSFFALGSPLEQAYAPTQVTGSPYATGLTPTKLAISNDGLSVYIMNHGADTITAYLRNVITGVLTPVAGSPFAVGGLLGFSNYISISPDGNFVYTFTGLASIAGFSRNPVTGVLTPLAGSPFAIPGTSRGILTTPDGLHLLNVDTLGIDVLDINPATGALTPVAGSPFLLSGASTTDSISISPDGNFVYVTSLNAGSDYINAYARDAATGALTPLTGSPYLLGVGLIPRGTTVSPDGQYLILVYETGRGARVFKIGSNGTLAEVAASPFLTASTPNLITMSPESDKIYISTNLTGGGVGGFEVYDFDSLTGEATLEVGSPYLAGGTIFGIISSTDGRHVMAVDSIANNIYVFQLSTAIKSPLLMATFDPSGGAGGALNIYGSLSVSGGLTLQGGVVNLAAMAAHLIDFANPHAVTRAQVGGFAPDFTSADQVIVAGALLTIPHGLAAIPSLVKAQLVNQNAEYGYVPGDVLEISIASEDNGAVSSYGHAVRVDDGINILARIGAGAAGNTFTGLNWATGVGVAFTNANWKVRYHAWK